MGKKKQWVEFDKNVKKYIKKRDGGKCVLCGNEGATQCTHVFLDKLNGGKGCKENGVSLCIDCINKLFKPLGKEEIEYSITKLNEIKHYLIEKENITVNKEFIDSLKFKKEKIPFSIEELKIIQERKCKDCIYLIRNKYSNNDIPSYFCKKRKQIVGKKSKVCYNFIER
jgi:hypothetical protein